jgi:hypothetical protein
MAAAGEGTRQVERHELYATYSGVRRAPDIIGLPMENIANYDSITSMIAGAPSVTLRADVLQQQQTHNYRRSLIETPNVSDPPSSSVIKQRLPNAPGHKSAIQTFVEGHPKLVEGICVTVAIFIIPFALYSIWRIFTVQGWLMKTISSVEALLSAIIAVVVIIILVMGDEPNRQPVMD